MKLKIRNWDKYNPKRDQKTYTWLRLENDIYSNSDFFEYDAQEMTVLVSLLCEASKKNTGEVEIGMRYFKIISRCDEDLIMRTLKKLENDKFLTISYDSDTTPDYPHTTPTYERTNVTNETNEQHVSVVKIKPDEVRNLFDEMLGGKGRIKKTPGHSFPSNLLVDFLNITGNAEFNSIDKWREYFELVAESDWLLNKFNTTFSWLLKPDNAFKVFEGQYNTKAAPKKSTDGPPDGVDWDTWLRSQPRNPEAKL